MFPGFVASHYGLDDLRVDLASFALRHHVNFVQGRIGGIDPVARAISLTVGGDEQRLTFELAALDVGSHNAMPEICGFERHGAGIKPLSGFADRLAAADPAAPATVIGGGVAAAEIALAMTRRSSSQVTLIEAGPRVAATLGLRARPPSACPRRLAISGSAPTLGSATVAVLYDATGDAGASENVVP